MGLFNRFRPGIKERLENKVLGKKENIKDPYYLFCKDCGCAIELKDTNCPKKIQKLIRRNYKTRSMASLALDKLNPRCPKCQAKFLNKGGKDEEPQSFNEAIKKAEQISEEIKQSPGCSDKPSAGG